MPQRTRAAQHRRLRIIAVQVARVAFVLLMTGNPPAERVAFLHLDAAGGNGLDGHADVALTFHRLLHRQRRIARQQRQRKQQPRHKLAGHVARQHIVARFHFAAHGQFRRAIRAHAHIPAHPARHKQIAVHVHRARAEPPMHPEHRAARHRQRNRHKEAQGRSAFAAVHHGHFRNFPLHSADGQGVAVAVEGASKRTETAHRRRHVRRIHKAGQHRFTLGQPCANHAPMRFRFGRWCADRADKMRWEKRFLHYNNNSLYYFQMRMRQDASTWRR